MKYDNVLLAVYFVALMLIILELSGIWSLAIVLMLVLIITLVQKINMEDYLKLEKKGRERNLNNVAESVAIISKNVEDVRYNLDKHMFVIENRIAGMRTDCDASLEKHYRELAAKIFDVENKLTATRKTLAAAFGSLDDRLQGVEDRKE